MLTLRKFKITNPYAGVDWDSWHHYKTNLHTHSTASDAQVDFSDMIKAYYDADFDILAMTDHGVVNHGWNQKPRRIPVLSVSSIIKKPTWLSDEEYGAILDGTYKNRGRGMTDLRYGIEINTAVFTKAHVNGFFTEYGQGLVGHENDFEGPVKGVAESGGLSVINHPGDWLESYVDVNHAHEKKNIELFADILKRYPSCLGIEAFNRIDTVTEGSPAQAAGIPIVAMSYNDFSDYLKWFKVFCNLNGQPELWNTVAMPALDKVVDVLCRIPENPENAPKVFAMFSATKDNITANTSNTVLGGMISEMQAVNISDADNTSGAERIEINMESVFAAGPDMIVVQCHASKEDDAAQLDRVYGGNAVWQSLRAVKEGKVYFLEPHLFHYKPNSRFADAYVTLAKILYPEIDFDN